MLVGIVPAQQCKCSNSNIGLQRCKQVTGTCELVLVDTKLLHCSQVTNFGGDGSCILGGLFHDVPGL
mgnify:CR=1 FL=1